MPGGQRAGAVDDRAQVLLHVRDRRRVAVDAATAFGRVADVVGADLYLDHVGILDVVGRSRVVTDLVEDVLGHVPGHGEVVGRDLSNPRYGQVRRAQLGKRRALAGTF